MPVSALARFLIVLGLALGVAGDILLNIRPWGLNVPIWCALAGAALIVIYRATRVPMNPGLGLALVGWILTAGLFAGRDSDALRAFNGLAFVVLTGVLLMELQPRWAHGLGWVGTLCGKLGLLLWRGFDVFETWARTRIPGRPESKARNAAIFRGIVFTAPILMVFGGLLGSADVAFESVLKRLVDFNLNYENVFSHVVGFVVSAWLALGLLSAPGAASLHHILPDPPSPPVQCDVSDPKPKPAPMVGLTEVSFILGGLALLFGLFVAVQFRYFFGGSAQVARVAGLSYADYARSGFFELVSVTVLAVPVLLGCRFVASREGPVGHKVFLTLGGLTIALLGIIMVSAWVRMGLYVEAYGLTALRFYVSAAMLWIGGVLAWLWTTSLRRTPALFAPGAAGMGILAVFAMNAMNPDARIASINLDRANRTGDLDLGYLQTLSADAGPTIEAALPKLSGTLQPEVQNVLAAISADAQRRDWRTWNYSSSVAAKMGSSQGSVAQNLKRKPTIPGNR